jgi:hypothetical protein
LFYWLIINNPGQKHYISGGKIHSVTVDKT